MPSSRSRSSVGTTVKTLSKKSNKRGKKLCEDGKNCKYQHEYQHLLEYHHSDDESKVLKKMENKAKIRKSFESSGRGRKLTTSKERQKAQVAPIMRNQSQNTITKARSQQRSVSIQEARLQFYKPNIVNHNEQGSEEREKPCTSQVKDSTSNSKTVFFEDPGTANKNSIIDLIDDESD